MNGKDDGIRITHDTVALCLGDLRTLVGQRVEGVTDFEALGMCDKCLDEPVIDPSLYIDAGSSTAALAMIEAGRDMSTRLTMKVLTDKIPWAAHFTAWSISASSKIIVGDFPPSSSVTVLRLDAAAAFMTVLPTAVLPVNATFSICICSAIAAPTVGP